MTRLLASRMNLRDDGVIEEFVADFETDDEREHTVMFGLDDHHYDERGGIKPIVFLSDFITSYNAFTEETALACAEMLDQAEEQMMITAADDYELVDGYTREPERYDLCVSTCGPFSNDHEAGLPRPTKADGCDIIAEEDARSGTRFVVRDWNGQLHQILFNDGRLADADSGYSMLSADTLDATFAAIRTVQAEHIDRGERIHTGYDIELYNADAVAEYRH